jgi:flagellar motor switch/type III secretory pathway protein FliN
MFLPTVETIGGRQVRRATFIARSNVPLQSVFAFAQNVQERAPLLFGRGVTVRATEPTVVSAQAAPILYEDAIVMEVVGRGAVLALLLRPKDARRIVAAAFNEQDVALDFSPIESEVIEKLLREVGSLAEPICGPVVTISRRPGRCAPERCESYFELLLEVPEIVRVGIALAADIAPRVAQRLDISALREVCVEAEAIFARGTVAASRLAHLRVGEVLPLRSGLREPASLRIDGATIALGECGTLHGRHAFSVDAIIGDALARRSTNG